ncbi:hypothetical protein EYF80_055227 [Liparis tanakae]|uniref:Uncharacterized protein n=1 Tax=Liparis tanakae TaxID=230148 RepID=A0A4Z2F078_9TELE|nr:hypothetical protein EYF80_055227 [Liparis tanakae]
MYVFFSGSHPEWHKRETAMREYGLRRRPFDQAPVVTRLLPAALQRERRVPGGRRGRLDMDESVPTPNETVADESTNQSDVR